MSGEIIAEVAAFTALWIGIHMASVGFRAKVLTIALGGIAIGMLRAVVFWLVVSKFM